MTQQGEHLAGLERQRDLGPDRFEQGARLIPFAATTQDLAGRPGEQATRVLVSLEGANDSVTQ